MKQLVPPKPFKSDGCVLVPDINEDIKDCCYRHDKEYWLGGSLSRRKKVDKAFRECIKKSGHPWIAWVYYAGVRMFGILPIAGARWGFGWEWPQYKAKDD